MTVHLEQLADEAILMRENHIGTVSPAFRAIKTRDWASRFPAHAALADQRQAALQTWYAIGKTPDLSCTETAGAVTITAVRHPAPSEHCYTLHYGEGDPAGRAWLCTTNELAGPGRYVAILDRPNGAYLMAFGDDLSYALYRVAALADRHASRTIREAAERGEIQ